MKKIYLILSLLIIASISFAYQIGPGDHLQITSINLPEINGDYIVSPDGYITIPYAGILSVDKKEVADVTKEISDKLSVRIKTPEVYISVTDANNATVFVTGLVKKPGSVVISSNSKLSSVIAQVGDISINEKNSAVNDNVEFTIKSLDGSKTTVDYKDLIDCDYKLKNGDIIDADIKGKVNVNVTGQVNTPGRYTLSSENNTVMSAILQAGGFKDEADYSNIKVYDTEGKLKNIDLSKYVDGFENADDTELLTNSTIVIPKLFVGITVIGWVNSPGQQIYQPNQTIYLSDVIAKAGGGVRNKAKLANVAVLRMVNGELTRTCYNFVNYQQKGDITGNPILQKGDVVFMPASTAIQWDVVLSTVRGLIGLGRDISQF